jgi:hypothetical protein
MNENLVLFIHIFGVWGYLIAFFTMLYLYVVSLKKSKLRQRVGWIFDVIVLFIAICPIINMIIALTTFSYKLNSNG